MIDQTKKFPNI